jgi:hypothetical protein
MTLDGMPAADVSTRSVDLFPLREALSSRSADVTSSMGHARGRGADVETWLKGLHYDDDDWTIAPGQESWISDAGRRKKNGERVYRLDGEAWGEPHWAVGDHIALYFGGTYKIPVLVEVTAPPVFAPKRVQREGRLSHPRAGEGERWPWLTEVVGVLHKPVRDASSLSDVGLEPTIVMRRTRSRLEPPTYRRIVRQLS